MHWRLKFIGPHVLSEQWFSQSNFFFVKNKSKKRMLYFLYFNLIKAKATPTSEKIKLWPNTYLAGLWQTGATVRAGCWAGAAQGSKALSLQSERHSLRQESLQSQMVARVCKAAASPLPGQSHTPGRTPHKPTWHFRGKPPWNIRYSDNEEG